MPWDIQILDHAMLLDKLNNTHIIGPFPSAGAALGGKTLVFNDPSATVTFPGEEGAMLKPAEIAKALREGVPGLQVAPRAHRGAATPEDMQHSYALHRDEGFTLAGGGTANDLFGFSKEEETTKRPLKSSEVKAVGMTGPGQFFLIRNPPEE